MVKKLLTICWAAGLALAARADTAEVDGVTWSYTVTNGTATITGGSCSGDVDIPSSLGGYPVTKIGDQAFWGRTGITSVTIPSGVTSLGYGAFYCCTGLTGVTIPSNVTSIADWTFLSCNHLTSVTIPSGVKSIGVCAFENCAALTSVTIPSNVTSIGEYAFHRCIGLTSVTIPASVTSFGGSVFYRCTGLKAVYFEGNAPNVEAGSVEEASPAVFEDVGCTVYVLCGKTGWGSVPGTWQGAKTEYTGTLTFTVRFNRNDGSGDTAAQTFTCGATQNLLWKGSELKWPTPAGYTFLGWATTADATAAKYTNGQKVTDIAAAGETLNLHAVWQSTTYSVLFNRNDGSGDTAVQEFTRGKAQQLLWKDSKLKWPNPADCTFLGWALTADATTAKYTNGQRVKDIAAAGETLNLYAVWKKVAASTRAASVARGVALAPAAGAGLAKLHTGRLADGSGTYELLVDSASDETLTGSLHIESNGTGVYTTGTVIVTGDTARVLTAEGDVYEIVW